MALSSDRPQGHRLSNLMRITSLTGSSSVYHGSIRASARHQQSLLQGAPGTHQKQITPLKADDTWKTGFFLLSKAFVQFQRSDGPTWKKGVRKEGDGEPTRQKQLLSASLACLGDSPGSTMTRDCHPKAKKQDRCLRTCPAALISQRTGEMISNKKCTLEQAYAVNHHTDSVFPTLPWHRCNF